MIYSQEYIHGIYIYDRQGSWMRLTCRGGHNVLNLPSPMAAHKHGAVRLTTEKRRACASLFRWGSLPCEEPSATEARRIGPPPPETPEVLTIGKPWHRPRWTALPWEWCAGGSLAGCWARSGWTWRMVRTCWRRLFYTVSSGKKKSKTFFVFVQRGPCNRPTRCIEV